MLLPIVAIIAVIFILVIAVYNSLVSLKVKIKEAWSQIDVQLKRRADLIPNIVETVKGYAAHEKEVFEKGTSEKLKSEKLKGMTFVVSGTFENFSRDEIKKEIEAHGGKNAGSISSKTTFVLAGENMGPEKMKKAASLKIPVISETEFLLMIAD